MIYHVNHVSYTIVLGGIVGLEGMLFHSSWKISATFWLVFVATELVPEVVKRHWVLWQTLQRYVLIIHMLFNTSGVGHTSSRGAQDS